MTNNQIFAFVDNSNIFIESQKVYGTIHTDSDMGRRYRLDFGKLFKYIAKERDDIFFESHGVTYPKLYGSEPPKMDSLWKFLEKLGVNVKVFTRNAFNKEKEVDTALVWDAAELIIKTRNQVNHNKTIVIAGGDRDFLKIYTEGKKAGYKVEFYCWEHSTSYEIKKLPTYYNLTPVIDEIGFLEKYKFEHDFGEINWGKVIPYNK